MRILIVEDEKSLAQNVIDFLKKDRLETYWTSTIQQTKNFLLSNQMDVVLLDLVLPDGQGMELVPFIKSNARSTKVIIVSANNSIDYKLIGLNSGADDYMTKPFSLPELKARIMAVKRRGSEDSEQSILQFNEIVVNLEQYECKIMGQIVPLTKKELLLLTYFLNNKRRVLSRQAIATHLWEDYTYNLDNIDFIYQHLKNLRKKIKDAGGGDYLKTIYGIGYKWCE
ncbi:response regulator transcription factor [Sphingobacterium sp. lm-10]|uniref:response regulator transcription factor n=1 Tax=Sphingobacterium sp. lm-10 TaxID=2944904 RepID=UPI002020E7BA|nr:response regulator transcription factor [Sphingobacterium sp. lm-10]MCL7986945.1 response regulator transcription factor [Sphingobacterium sp. lm-10]